MSAGVLSPGSESALADAVLERLRSDAGVQAAFGSPARIFDGESPGAAYPFALLERHESEPAGSAGWAGAEHRLTFIVASRHGGRREAKRLIGLMRAAIETAPVTPPGQAVVLAHLAYADVVRAADRRSFRGLARFRIITEEAD